MKGGSKLFIFAGIGLALVAVLLLIMNPTGGDKADAEKNQESSKVTVVQAKVDIPAHQILALTDLVEVEVPSSDAPAGAVTSIGAVVGQAYRIQLTAGQPLLSAQIEVPGLRNDITAGKRAIAFPVDEISAMSGLVQDGDYIDIIFRARINLIRNLPTTAVEVPEDAVYEIKDPVIIPPDLESPNHPPAGDPGSEFIIRDDVGDAGQLEPVAKIMLQDIRILRVVRPGESFLGNGSKAETVAGDGGVAPSDQAQGQLIVEVTPEQAELLSFLQDSHAEYQVIVRSKDDHATVNTTGITYSILATDADWMLPWPKTVIAPSEQTSGSASAEEGGDESETESGT